MRTAALLGAGADAEDVVQEAFVKAYGALDRFRPDAPFRPWLLRIVANETRNLHRGSGRRAARERRAWERTEPLLLARPDDPAAAALSRERREELVRGLAQLSREHAAGRDLPIPARPRRGRDRGSPRLAARHREVPAAPVPHEAPGRARRRVEPTHASEVTHGG